MTMANATVQLPYKQVREMEETIKELTEKLAAAELRVQEATLGAGDGSAGKFRDAFFVAFAIVQYSIGHLDPMTFRGWPYPRLFQLSALLKELPYLPDEMREMSSDLALLAKECKKWEDARKEGREKEMLAEENARRAGVPYGDMELSAP